MTNPADAKVIEGHISINDLKAFVFEDKDDLNTFQNYMKEQRLKVNSVTVPSEPVSSFVPTKPISAYK